MSTKTLKSAIPVSPTLLKWGFGLALVGLLGAAAYAVRDQWIPHAKELLAFSASKTQVEHIEEPSAAQSAGHGGHDANASIELSKQARKNINLKTALVELQPYDKTISMPALVVERPGRSQVEVTAPLGGRVTRVYPIQGEAVVPGQRLFDLRLTHEELVTAQSELLRSAEEVKVVSSEIARLASVSLPGAIPGKTKREREYEQQKLQAGIKAQRQSLELHGLTTEQIDAILETGKLLQGIEVVAPPFPPNGHVDATDHPFHVQKLEVKPGQYVDAGESLCVLADHHELFIEGRAFEQDIQLLHRAANEGWKVSAAPPSEQQPSQLIEGLEIFYLSDTVEKDSRPKSSED